MALKPVAKMILIFGAVALVVVVAAKFIPEHKSAVVVAPTPVTQVQAAPLTPPVEDPAVTRAAEAVDRANRAAAIPPVVTEAPPTKPSNNVSNGDAGMAALLKRGQK